MRQAAEEYDSHPKYIIELAKKRLKTSAQLIGKIVESTLAQKKYQTLFNRASDAIFLTDTQTGVIIDANRKAEMLLGRERHEIIGMHQRQLHPEELREQVTATFRTHFEKGIENLVDGFYVEHKDGHTIPVEISPSIIEVSGEKLVYGIFRNITERKQAEDELRKSEERYRILIEQCIAGIGVSHDGRILFANKALCDIFGVDDAETFRSKSLLDYATPESKQKIIERMEMIKAGETVPNEFKQEIIRSDGEVRTLLLQVSDIEYEGKKCRQSSFIDITDKKRLEEIEERFKIMFQQSPYAIALTDVDSGKFIDVNEILVQKTGYQREEIIGKTTTSMGFYSEEDRDRFIRLLTENGFVDSLDMKFKIKSDILDTRMYARVIQISSQDYLLTMFEDVTEVKKAEKVLKEEEEKYCFIAENVNDIIIIFDDQFTITYANPALTRLFGYAYEDIKGLDLYTILYNEDTETLKEKIKARKTSHVHTNLQNYQIKTKSGEIKWVEAHSTYQYTSDRNLNRVVSVIRDITEHKEYEKKINASLKEKETLLQEIHHRVKNNLTVVSSLLKLQANEIDDERLKEAMNESQSRVYAMSAVHEMLHGSENLSEIDLKNYLTKITNSIFQTYSTDRGKVKLSCNLDDSQISLNQAYPLGLTINELISNSLKYAFPEDRQGEITVSMKNLDNELELIVMDDGIGIPDDLDWKNSKSLGLKLVRTLVENQLDGSIDMESNNGTKFTIKFNIET